MKKMNLIVATLFAFSALIGFSFTVIPVEEGIYNVSTADSHVQWKGYKVTGEHYGVVNLKEGKLEFDKDGMLSGGKFVIDMTTIKTLDLQGEYAGKLEGHLKSDDFFGVEKHPYATLEITDVAAKGTPNEYKITGNLTIKETTKEIKFYATIEPAKDNMVTAKADIKIDRSEFDVRYGSGSFFDNLGDKTIYDEFDMSVSITASK